MATKTKVKPKAAKPRAEIPATVDQLLSREQVAAALGVSPRMFDEMRSTGSFPGPDKQLGTQTPRWRVSTFNAWVRGDKGAADGVGG